MCIFSTFERQKRLKAVSFWHFWLPNVLRVTTACTFSTSQLPKVVRMWGAFNFWTSKCASRHNGVQLFISHLASWLRTRRFSKPNASLLFDPPEPQINRKTQRIATSLPFRTPASSLIISFLFFSLTLPTSAFPTVHIVGSFTSKFPSNMDIDSTLICKKGNSKISR